MWLTQVGLDTVLEVDINGGGNSFEQIVVFQNTTSTTFTVDNIIPGFPPDGSGITGSVVTGTALDELLNGTIGDDTIDGLDVNGTLNGENGNDIIDAGAGDNILNGGFGSDLLTGGGSSDVFIFTDGQGRDAIADFVSGAGIEDPIDLTAFGIDFATVLGLAIDNLVTGSLEIELTLGTILVGNGVLESSLDADDFLF